MTLFSSSSQGVPFQSQDAAGSAKAVENRTVFKNEDRPVFRSEAKQANAFVDYVKGLNPTALPGPAVGQGLPTMAVMQPAEEPRPANQRLDRIKASSLGPDAAQVLDNDFGNVKDPRGSFHRFGKIGLLWGAGVNGQGMPQPIAQAQDIGKVIALENKNRLGEVTRLTYRDANKAKAGAGADTGRELQNNFKGVGENRVMDNMPKNDDQGEKKKGEKAEKEAAAAQQAKIEAIEKARNQPISAYSSGFSAAW